MESTKFVGMDVHKDAITIAVMNSAGKVIMESIIETKAVTILQFIQGLRGESLGLIDVWPVWSGCVRAYFGRAASMPSLRRD